MTRIYIKLVLFWRNIYSFFKCIEFATYLNKLRVFQKGEPILILKVIQKYFEIAKFNYTDTEVLNRDVNASVKLLGALIDTYFENKSEVTLNQFLEVLKTEFIKRK